MPDFSIAPAAVQSPPPLLAGAAIVVLDDPIPVVKAANAAALAPFILHGGIDGPGAYVAFWSSEGSTRAYVGQSSHSVASRLRDPKFRPFCRPDLVVTVTATGFLTAAHTRVVERTLHLTLLSSGVAILGEIPVGAVVRDDEYAQLRHFCAGAIRQMQAANLAFDRLPPRLALAGPVTEPGVVLDVVPEGRRFRLEMRHGTASLVETPTSFVVLPGSTIRDPGYAPATRAMGVLRQELSYAGILQHQGEDQLISTRALRFASASAATRFVTGGAATSPTGWKATDGQGALRRVPRTTPVAPALASIPLRPLAPEPAVAPDTIAVGGLRHE